MNNGFDKSIKKNNTLNFHYDNILEIKHDYNQNNWQLTTGNSYISYRSNTGKRGKRTHKFESRIKPVQWFLQKELPCRITFHKIN